MPRFTCTAKRSESAAVVIEAAKALMVEVGFGAMSMRQLANRAGLLPGSLYHHVSSKQELLLMVILDVLEERDKAWRRVPRRKHLQEELKSFITFVLAWQLANPADSKILQHEQRHLDAPLQAWLSQRPDRLSAYLPGLLRKSQQQGVLGDLDVDSMVAAIMALLGTADALRRNSVHWLPAQLESHFLHMVLRLLDVKRHDNAFIALSPASTQLAS
ncbi:TetR/AcrR family transcriptional regulator [Pseudomonas sp. NPDC089396]|uniref:TetR/AcrR family transcriptional regulator n=1 Tax=Pseudomonas sp. NPDC089396 TaxID=3364461 RepID=UPI002D73BCE1|nr:TetR/AcrR family transcriptional regulator [Pseudomonas sp.]